MASSFEDEFESTVNAEALELFGEIVTHKPRNRDGSEAPITVIFQENSPVRDPSDIHGVRRTAKLHVPEAVVLTPDDMWMINSKSWTIEEIGEPKSGLVEVNIARFDHERGTFPR